MNKLLKNKLLIGITGSIAAYKSILLVREAVKAGYDVRVILSKAAHEFVTPLTLQALSRNKVYTELFDLETERSMGHIELAKWADLILIAPASANSIAKIANGYADNLLTSVVLAKPQSTPLLIAPAMNCVMYQNASTIKNLKTLDSYGYRVLKSNKGEQACGDDGFGRMLEVEQLLDIVNSELGNFTNTTTKPVGYTVSAHNQLLNKKMQYQLENISIGSLAHTPKHRIKINNDLPNEINITEYEQYLKYIKGKKILITAGPTREMIDPVRYITNHSSGKMGVYIAAVAQKLGVNVTLVTGPINIEIPKGIRVIKVDSAVQMNEAVLESLTNIDCFIGCAAVSDFRAKEISTHKIKKVENTDTLTLELVKNPDILYNVSNSVRRPKYVVGFAAETTNIEEYACNKLITKGCDAICANNVSKENQGWNSDYNHLVIYKKDNFKLDLGYDLKENIAKRLILEIAKTLYYRDIIKES